MRHCFAREENRVSRRSGAVWTALLILLAVMQMVAIDSLMAAEPAAASKPRPPAWPHSRSDLSPDPAVIFGGLDNGLRYVLMKNRRPEERVSVHLYVHAGSMNETEDQRGLAHFLEHMLFNGSTHFPPGELVRYFQSIGMQFGNDANAHTGFDETVYDLILPTGNRESLQQGLLVMGDYAMGALLLEEEVKRESKVILAEMRSRDSAGYRTLKATLQFEFPDALISQRMPIGRADVIRQASRRQLKAFYDAWYRPDNMVLVMVGDFDPSLAERLIAERFGDFQARAPRPAIPAAGHIDHKGLQVFYHHEPEAGGTTVGIETVRADPPHADSLARQRREMLADLADRIVQNRLDARLKSPDAPFTDAAVGSGTYLSRIRYAEISADSNSGQWRPTLSVIEQELRRARLFGFTAAELDRVRKDTLKMLSDAVREAPTRDSTALARGIIRDLANNRVIQSPAQEQAQLAPLIEAATPAAVHQAFLSHWPDDQRLVLVTGRAEIAKASPAAGRRLIRAAFLASAATVVKPPAVRAGAVFPYLPPPSDSGTVASREVLGDLGITRIRFANGVCLNVKRTEFKTNEVLVNLILGHGISAEPQNRPGLSRLAEATVAESALGGMDSDQLERALAGRSTTVDFSVQETHLAFAARSVSGELELMLQLLYAHLTDPGLRDDALTLARERLHQAYRSARRSVEGMMRMEGLRLLAGGDSRFGMPAFDRIGEIGLAQIRAWLVPQLDHAPLELSVVGDVDVQAVIELTRRYLGSLPPRGPDPGNPRRDLPRLPTGTVSRIKVDTQIPKALVVAAWRTDDFWDIHRTRRLSVLADVFSERLRERIREKLGAAYSPYAFNRSSRAYPGYGVFQAYITVAPEQSDAVLAEVRAIAADLAASGVAADELKRAIDPIRTSIKESRQTNGYWLNSVMTGSTRHPQQLAWARSFLADFAAVTREEISTLAAAYLTEKRAAAIIVEPRAE